MENRFRGRLPAVALTGLCALVLCACDRARTAAGQGPGMETEPPAPAGARPAVNGLTAEVARVAGSLAPSLDGQTVAVLDLADLRGQVTQLGTYVSEQLTTELVRSGQARVLERKQVLQVLEELNLRKADLSTSEVALAGEQLGANVIVVGSAAAVGRNVEGNVRAVRVNGAALLAADRFTAAAPDEILRLAGQSVPTFSGGGGGTPGAQGTPEGPITQATIGPVQAVLNECGAAGSIVTCTFTFTSATVDAGLHVYNYNSEVRDEGGNAYQPSEFTFGSENGSEWQTVLVARESTPGRLMISGVPITMTRLTRISVRTTIRIGERELSGQEMVFRNVPIAR
jgi:curli biogenesis system outer membrane secretion channel CsgG